MEKKITKVAFLGIGLMGFHLASHLLKGGITVVAWNRTESKAQALHAVKGDLIVASSPKEAIKDCPVIVSVLFTAKSFNEVLDDLDDELFKGKTFISVSTISPDDSLSFLQKVTSKGGEYFESPILGNSEVARKAELQVIVGSTPVQYEKFKDFYSLWGTPRYTGEVGTAAKTKLALNYFLGSNLAAFTSSYGYLSNSGVDTDTFKLILENGPFNLAHPYFEMWNKKLKERHYDEVSFTIAGIQKDVGMLLEEAKKVGVNPSHLEGTYNLFTQAANNKELLNKDMTSVYECVNKRK